MQASMTLQRVIETIASKHQVDLTKPEAHLRLAIKHFDPLEIKRTGDYVIEVTHYYEVDNRMYSDPQVVLFEYERRWYPIEVEHYLVGRRVYGLVTPDGQDVVTLDLNGQTDLAEYTEAWSEDLQEQCWLEHGNREVTK